MHKKVSLQTIINSFLEERNVTKEKSISYDADSKRLRRSFEMLIERLGSDKECLKQNGKMIEFDKGEIPFMKILLSQLYDNKGIIAEFTNKKSKVYSSTEVHEFIQSLLDEADKEGFEEDEIRRMGEFFISIFQWSPLRSVEYCHTLIDSLAMTLQDLTMDEQAVYLSKVEHILKKEYAIRFAEFTLNTEGLAHIIEEYKKKLGCNSDNQFYYEYEPEIRFQYIERDKRILEAMQEDDDLRQYIEKKFGKKAEEIFNYAKLDM